MLESGVDVLVRDSMPADAEPLAALFRSSWELAYQGIIPQPHLEALIQRRGPAWWKRSLRKARGTLIVDVAGTVAGYATCGASRQRGKYQGEIYELYLAPDFQGLGLGEHLFEASRHNLDMRQLRGLVVWALLDNTMACDFYWRRGGRPIAQAKDKFGDVQLTKVAFGWH